MTATIPVTNNYFQDLAAYISAAGLPNNFKLKKAALYAEIEQWNQFQAQWDASEPPATTEVVEESMPSNVVEVTTDNSFDDLFANWQQAKVEKAVAKTTKSTKAKTADPEWDELADRLAADFAITKERSARATIVYELRQKYSTKAIATKLGISDRDVTRKANAVDIFHNCERMRSIVSTLIPWGRFESNIGILSPSRYTYDQLCDKAIALQTVA